MRHLIVHQTLIRPNLRTLLAGYAALSGNAVSSDIGHIHLTSEAEPVNSWDLGFPKSLLLKAEMYYEDVADKQRLLKIRLSEDEYGSVDVSKVGVEPIDYNEFKKWLLNQPQFQTESMGDMVVAKMFCWHPSNPIHMAHLTREIERLGYVDLGATAHELLHRVTNGVHPAGTRYIEDSVPAFTSIEEALLDDKGVQVDERSFEYKRLPEIEGIKFEELELLEIGGTIYNVSSQCSNGRIYITFKRVPNNNIVRL